MTLYKQIALVVTLGFLLLLSLVAYDNLKQSAFFLGGQLNTTAQDTATVLGIAISTTGSSDDIAALETMFNAVFDSGYYSDIRFVSNDGTVIYEKSRPLTVKGVPNWFVNLMPLSLTPGEATVQSGWSQTGRLELVIYPGFAYAGLYERLTGTVKWFSVIVVVVLSLLWFVLHIILKPLKAVHQQANAIQENRFIQLEALPRTTELRRVVEAMNRLSLKVKEICEEQQAALAENQRLLYSDELTQLRNRRYFMTELLASVSEKSGFHGSLLVLKIVGLEALRERQAYQTADSVVLCLAKLIRDKLSARSEFKFARINDDEFALLVNAKQRVAVETIASLFEAFAAKQPDSADGVYLVGGIAGLSGGSVIGQALSEIDLLLSKAQTTGPYQYAAAEARHLSLPQGRTQWRDYFERALVSDKFYLVAQPAMDASGRVLHREVLVRLNDENGVAIPAGIFMPMAVALGFELAIYRKVNDLLPSIISHKEIGALAINFSDVFIGSADDTAEFNRILAYFRKGPAALCVEVTHDSVKQYPERITKLAAAARRFGHSFGVDRLDLDIPLDTLQSINPDYIKISAETLAHISSGNASAGYKALRNITRTLDIKIIAVGVDEQELFEHLLTLGIDGMQGNFLGKPEKII